MSIEDELTAALARAEKAERAADWFAKAYQEMSLIETSHDPESATAWLERKEEPK